MTFDPGMDLKIAMADKTRPLKIKEGTRTTTCVINGCPLDEHSWVVSIPKFGLACPGCAADKGWEVG